MAVSYVGATSGNSGSATSTSFVTSFPAGWAAGDVAVLTGHVSAATLTMSTPAGWTAVTGITNPTNESTNSRVYAWWRVLQAGDSAPTISNSGSVTGGWGMAVYRGADMSSPIGQASAAGTAAATSRAFPSLTGVAAGSALHGFAHARVASGTIPSGLTFDVAYTESVDVATSRTTANANVRLGAAYRLISSAGSYGGESVTVANAVSSSMIAALVEVKQATSADATVAPDGLSVPAAVGDATAAWSVSAAPDGVAAAVAVGGPVASWAAVSAPDGVPVGVAVGSPSAAWSGAVAPDGLAVPVEVGVPSAVWSGEVAPDGLLAPVAVGSAGVSLPGHVVVRPDVGAVTRPGSGVVARPDAGVVPRVTGVVVRPDAGLVSRP